MFVIPPISFPYDLPAFAPVLDLPHILPEAGKTAQLRICIGADGGKTSLW
jgi:hypothetical protein